MPGGQPSLSQIPALPNQWTVIRRCFAVMLIIFGSILLLGTLFWTLQAYERRDWPSTSGHVTASKASATVRTETDSQGRRRTITEYRTFVNLTYRVGDKGYTSAVALSGDSSISFPPGKAQTIYYDPLDPTRITIDKPDAAGTARVGLVIGAGILLVGVLLWRFPRAQ